LDFKSNVTDLEKFMGTVENIKEFFLHLNKIGSIPFLLLLCQMIPWTGYRFLDSLPDPKGILTGTSTVDGRIVEGEHHDILDVDADLFVKLYNWCILLNSCVIIYFCAETKSLVILNTNITYILLSDEAYKIKC